MKNTYTLTATAAAVAAALAAPVSAQADAHSAAMEQRIMQLENALRGMQSELTQLKSTSGNVAKLEEKVDTMSASGVGRRSNMVFFRGGYANLDGEGRAGKHWLPDARGILGSNGDDEAWYVGAGFDFSLTPNTWGMLEQVEVAGELMFNYTRWTESGNTGRPLTAVVTGALREEVGLTGAVLNDNSGVEVSTFTLTAAPKLKFFPGSKFRPWLIPAGLAIHVTSPPTDSVTVLQPGAMFGAGMDYNIWEDLYLGVDGRYFIGPKNDGVELNHYQIGAYLGIGF